MTSTARANALLICYLGREAGLADLLEAAAPGVMDWRFSVGVCGAAVDKFDYEASIEICGLHASGLGPDIFDAGNLCGHFLEAGDHFVLLGVGGAGAKFDQRNGEDSFWLAEMIGSGLACYVAGGEDAGGYEC